MKAAFTRAYNKEVHLTPYSLQAVKKGRRGGGGGGESELGGEDVDNEVQESEDEGEGLKTDAMIKVRALKSTTMPQRPSSHLSPFMSFFCFVSLQQKKAKATKEPKKEKKEDSGKGKGKGTGKGKGKAKK